MSDVEATDPLSLLERDADAWNRWRADNPMARPVLADVDLTDRELQGINLSELDLTGVDFYGADLSNANLKMAQLSGVDMADCTLVSADLYKADLQGAFLTGADLSDGYVAEANLSRADLRGATFRRTNLTAVRLVDADLGGADLSDAVLNEADVVNANMSRAILERVSLFDLKYGSFKSMRGHYFGVRGLDSCFGNALFVRDVRDLDYLDALQRSVIASAPGAMRRIKLGLLRVWEWVDYGRNLGKPALYAVVLALAFGVVYAFDLALDWGLMDYSSSSGSWLSPFYYSIVTYTTLGFGDITPQHWLGEIIVITEVVLGYTTLGLLLAILANRVARQS